MWAERDERIKVAETEVNSRTESESLGVHGRIECQRLFGLESWDIRTALSYFVVCIVLLSTEA